VVIGTTITLAALCGSTGSTPAYGADSPARPAVTSYTVVGDLSSVAAVSPTDAWAVGYTGTSAPKTLIVHWNGRKWSAVTNPKPITGGFLGVTAVSADNVWAAGFAGSVTGTTDILVMHWNGKSWSRLPGVPTVAGGFNAIAQTGNVLLAVGGLDKPPMLLMQRTGTAWKTYPPPSAPGDLQSLAVTGRDRAWATGVVLNSADDPIGDILLQWNGSAWRSVSFPLHGTNQNLWSLAAGPGGAIWAVGNSHNNASTSFSPLSMLGNGKTWRKVAVHAPANSALYGVSFVPGGTAWAVGTADARTRTLILRWTGKAWSQVPTPDPLKTSDFVNAVAATSRGDAWAVGSGGPSKSPETFILHWNGKTWS
jgi:hypothetical protein